MSCIELLQITLHLNLKKVWPAQTEFLLSSMTAIARQ